METTHTLVDDAANLVEAHGCNVTARYLREAKDVIPDVPLSARPIPMVLYCTRCGLQHIDKPAPEKGWDNPPHRSHECQGCGCIWRPADVPTTGVECIETRGKDDTWINWRDGPGRPALVLMDDPTPAMIEAVGTILSPYAAKLVWKRMLEVARSL